MPTLRLGAVAAAVLTVALSAAPARATVVRALDVAEKAQIAKLIVLAKVERQEPRWMIENGSIKTVITLTVEETIKGEAKAGQKITVVIPGGQIGDFVHSVPGVSDYVNGERAVLFLEPHPDGWVELGIGIGKYDVKTVNGKTMVTHDPKVATLRTSKDGPSKIEPATKLAPVSLPKFLAQVRAALASKVTR